MMQNYKKIFIGSLAIVLILCGFVITMKTALGAESFKGNLLGKGNMENTGEMKNVFKVVLPVVPEKNVTENEPSSSIYDFILDPKSLVSTLGKYKDKTFEPGSTMYFQNAVGSQYDYSKKSDILKIQNKGMMNVDVELRASLTGMDDIRLVNDDIFTDDKNPTAYLALEDSNGKISAVDKYGSFLKAIMTGCKEAYKIGYDTNSQKYGYVLKSDSELQAEQIVFSEYGFWLTGACNSADRWPDLNGVIEPRVEVVWKVAPRPDNSSPSIGKNIYTMTTGRAVSIDVDLGSGNLAATGIKEIRFVRASGGWATLSAEDYAFENGMLKINASCISGLLKAGVASREYTIVFDDKATTGLKVTLVAEDEAPSVEGESYFMTNGNPIEINVNLGSGSLGATGISEIKFTKKTGELGTLPVNNYTFANGKLKINASWISDILKAGTTSCDHVIIFNDKAKTEKTIKLVVDGIAPSISVNAYTVSRERAVEVNVDLGSGELKATGISEVKFTRKTGELATLPISNYVFSDGVLKINASWVSDLISAGTASCEHVVIFNDVAKTSVKITLTAEEKVPTVAIEQYIMKHGQPVQVSVDLGSGSVGATGISEVKFTRKTGELATLQTSNYTFVDGVLNINASWISSMINAGTTSCDHIIVFNDVAKTEKRIKLVADGASPSIQTKTYTMSRGRTVEISVDLGSNDLKATGISEVKFTRKSGELATLAANNYTYEGGILKLNASWITAMMNTGTISCEHVVIFNDVAKTNVKIMLTAEEKKPTVALDEYAMRYGQPVQVNVDLGSGNIGATGISEVKFTKKTGELATLATSNYVFTDGVLKLNASWISSLINAGTKSCDHIIIFNDAPRTEKRIKLAVNGEFPSIQTKTYTMSRGKAVDVTVDLGSGDLKATGIREVKFTRKNGELATLAASNYTFTGGILRINASWVSDMANAGTTSCNHVVIFNDVAATNVKITLASEEKSPSIAQGNYTMRRNQPIQVSIDLGSGTIGASGIKSVMFKRKTGDYAILASSNYMFSNGILTFNASWITSIINAGTTSCEHIIYLNDKAGTMGKVILKQ